MSLIVSVIKELVYSGFEAFSRYYSKYRGFVVDNQDPQKFGRLRLKVPEIAGDEVYDYWAWPSGVFAGSNNGKGYGSQVIPQKGDLVWVEFERGHPTRPVWTMGYRAERELPDESDTGDTDCYWFITPKGIVIKLNDTKNYIHIKTQEGDYIELNNESISLVTGKQISLGSLNKSQQPALMGNDTKKVHEEVEDYLTIFTEALGKDLAESLLTGSPFLTYKNLTQAILKMKPIIDQLPDKIKIILSDTVTLNK